MDRRSFMALTATVSLAPVLAPSSALAAETLDYTPGLVKQLLSEGKTVFVDFSADWCSTCRTQERRIGGLRSANKAYDDAMTFVRVDWDEYSRGALSKELKIPRRSTLVILKGNSEVGRVVARTSQKDIKALMDAGVAAATA